METETTPGVAHATLRPGMKIYIDDVPGTVIAATPAGGVVVKDMWKRVFFLQDTHVVTLAAATPTA